MRSSYKSEDVTILLKDVSGMVEPESTAEREKQIQAGRHYSEMLPIEYKPTQAYMETYEQALASFGKSTAKAVASVSEKIIKVKGENIVLVSLARAGIPAGILIKKYIKNNFGIDISHYAISIIRGRGIDKNAMRYILERHKPKDIQFVDGWTGKGAILGELEKDVKEFKGVSSNLAVIADPAWITSLCGTHEDLLIPSSCLNSTISGLISRTFLRKDIIGSDDFHGAVYYDELENEDLSQQYIDYISSLFPSRAECSSDIIEKGKGSKGICEVKKIAEEFSVKDINLIKPGIGETTRVLLRRIPWKVLIRTGEKNNSELAHLIRLAEEKSVPVEEYPLNNYKACGIIKNLNDI